MNKDSLETYLNIVKTRSFTKTAEYMFISQSAVSNRLVSLENELGVKLLERRPGQKGIDLTQKGIEFTTYAQRYLDLDRQVRDWTSGNTTEVLRVASVVSLTEYILQDFFFQLLSRRSQSITLSTHWTDRIIAMLENREADIGLTPRVFRSKSIQVSPIFDEPLYLVSNTKVSDYPDFVDVKTLKRANEIHFDWGLSFMDWHDRQLNPFETPLAITDTTQLIPKLLQLPGSFSIIPLGLFKHYDDKDLKLSRITPAPPPRTCYLLRLKEPASNKLESILHFETEFRQYAKGVDNLLQR